MSPRYFIDVRRTFGGPAPAETSRALAASRASLDSDRAGWKARREALHCAEQALEERVRQL
jgi:hypothetical protein